MWPSTARFRAVPFAACCAALACLGVPQHAQSAAPAPSSAASPAEPIFPFRYAPLADGNVYQLYCDDIDRDGDSDVLAQDGNGNWAAFASDDHGGFGALQALGPEAPLGDLDGDGITELLRASPIAPSTVRVDVRRSNGVGGFAPVQSSTLPGVLKLSSGSLRAASGSLNGDGFADAYVYGSSLVDQQVIGLFGDGAGGFTNLVGYAAGGKVWNARLGDLAGDGSPDFVVTRENGVALLPGNGLGGFATPQFVYGPSSLGPIELADLDVDGFLDASVLLNSGLAFFEGDGQGGFQPAVVLAVPSVTSTQALQLRDLDADGIDDLVTNPPSGVVWYPSRAGAAPAAYQTLGFQFDVGAPPVELDGDGVLDWIMPFSKGLLIASGVGAKPRVNVDFLGGFVRALCAADLDEVAGVEVATLDDFTLRTYAGDGAGSFTVASSFQLTGAGRALAALDFDVDGHVDLAAAMGTYAPLQGNLRIYSGFGGGTIAVTAGTQTALVPLELRVADLDGDGGPDLVTAESNGSSPAQHGLGVYPAAAHAFATPSFLPIDGDFQDTSFLELADFDLDGDLDALTGPKDKYRFFVAPGDGNGGFLPPLSFVGASSGEWIYRARTADFDADGRADVVCGGSGALRYCAATGALQFAAPQAIHPVSLVIAVGDLDRDGSPEVIANASTLPQVVLQRDGAVWKALDTSGMLGDFRDAQFVDYDADGDTDLITYDTYSIRATPNVRALPAGLAPYGVGTPSCKGVLSAVANVAPHVGASDFKLAWTNAPANASALVGISFAPDVAGSDLLGVGVSVHIGLLGPVLVYSVASDASGAAKLAFPVPNVPELAGFSAYTQALWIEPAWQSCSSSPLPWSSSRGLAIAVLP